MRPFLAELRRRNVDRAAAFYAAAGWLLVQVATQVFPFFEFPNWSVRLVIIAVLVGFPFLLLFAWFYEVTPEGLRLERDVERHESITHHTGRKLDRWIIATLALAVVVLLADRFVLRKDSGSAPADHSIAVLPFVDMSAEKDQEYMSDGLAEELLNLLAKIPALQVTSRTSAFAFKGKSVGAVDIARQLNVAHILEGSVRKAGNKLRITAQLIDTRSDTHLWSETYDRTLDDILAVQDEIAAAVVAQLKLALLKAPTTRKSDPKAFALVLQARQTKRQGTPESAEEAIRLFQQALAIDPACADAWSDIASVYVDQANKGLKPAQESYALARAALDKAVAIAPDLTSPHVHLSRIATDYDHDTPAAIRHLDHALALAPTDPQVIAGVVDILQNLNRHERAIEFDQYLVVHDPLSPSSHGRLAYDLARSARLEEAVAAYRTALRLAPHRIGTHYNIGEILLRLGKTAAALDEMRQEPAENYRLPGIAIAQYALGDRAGSDATLADFVSRFGDEEPLNIALAYAFRRDNDRAFEWLGKAVEKHDVGLVELPGEPTCAAIHDDPRWLPLLRGLGMAPDQLAAIRFEPSLPKPVP